MSKKKRIKKGIKSLDKQIKIHLEKIRIAEEQKDEGLIRYHEREIRNFEFGKDKKKRRLLPKLKRKKNLFIP